MKPGKFATIRLASILAPAFFCAVSLLFPSPAAAGVSWPAEWKVFLAGERSEEGIPSLEERTREILPGEKLADIPERLEIEGRVLEGRWVEAQDVREYHGFPVLLENTILDLAPLFGEVAAGNTAWVFLPIESGSARTVEIGMGADWWMRAWLNGEEIIDTTEGGNGHWPPMIDNHRAEIKLREGLNVLAVRFISGAGSSVLAVGGPGQLAALGSFLARAFPEPGRDQAYWSARERIDLALPDVNFGRGALAGVEALPERQFTFTGNLPDNDDEPVVRDVYRPRFEKPLRLLLSKSIYPAEDRHLDAVAWVTPEEGDSEPAGRLELVMRDWSGRRLSRQVIEDIPAAGVFFSIGFPRGIIGRRGELEVRWVGDGGEELGAARGGFDVSAPSDVARSGRVGISIPNDSGATIENAPLTVGVPFPRGALLDPEKVRLVDEAGAEVPLQARVSARWSRYGYIKWLLCDFTADLSGGPRYFHLEYGSGVSRVPAAPIAVSEAGAGFPAIDAGRLRVSGEGLWYDLSGEGDYRAFLEGGALTGEFVEHADGRRFTVPGNAVHEIEEQGSEKVVVRRVGWYGQEGGEGEFCNYVTRLVFHRDSPVVRIYHTWVFTGDGNRERIRNMGWRFPLAEGLGNRGFLSSFEDGSRESGESLVQWDYNGYDVLSGDARNERAGGRAPGVAAAGGDGANLYFGVKDFWQNFPGELEFSENAFTFYNWPAHNRPASFERPVEVGHAYRHRFAHEGEALDFRLPEEYGLVDGEPGPIAEAAMRLDRFQSRHYNPENLESANAQGIARTEEIFLYLGREEASAGDGARVMRGLNDETLRAVVDPAWVAESLALGRIRQRDKETFPEEERVYTLVCEAPSRWADRLEIYGKWIFGDIAAWDMDLANHQSNPYRAYRKAHHGWPFRWTPFARSGDPTMLRHAERATRQMIDANFCHYASDQVDESVGENYTRRQGWWLRGMLPWTGKLGPKLRDYIVECDYLWHSYYLTGFRRSRDVALLFGEQTKHDTYSVRGVGRDTQSIFPSYLDMYQATFDPWFLVAAHSLAEIYLKQEALGGPDFWRPAASKFIEFSGCPRFTALYLEMTEPESRSFGHEQSLGWHGAPKIMANAYAWHLGGNDYHLGRLAGELDWVNMSVYEGEVGYLLGHTTLRARGAPVGLFTGWYIQEFPFALRALAKAGRRVEPVANAFRQQAARQVIFHKREGQEVALFMRPFNPGEKLEHRFTLEGPGARRVMEGAWPLPGTHEERVPAGLPAGTYTLNLDIEPRDSVYLPMAFHDVPEVFTLGTSESGTFVPAGDSQSQYWFLVPRGIEDFWVEFPARGELRRMSIWNPDGERAWDKHFFAPDYDGPDTIRAEVRVTREQAGRLWRVTIPGSHHGFRLDPRIPPVFSVSREKWFDPDAPDNPNE